LLVSRSPSRSARKEKPLIRPAIYLLLILLSSLARPAASQGLFTVKPAGKEPTLTLGGLLQVQAETGDRVDTRWTNDNDRFLLRRARLNAAGKFLEEFDFRLELDLAGSLSNTSGLRAQMTDGYITWNRHPAANIRVGQFKTAFGYEQLYSDPRLLTAERSLMNDRLTLSRQLGAQVGGDLFEKRLSYAVGLFNGNSANNNFNDDDRFVQVGRLSGVLWQGKLGGKSASWSLGGNGFTTRDSNVALSGEFGFDSTPATADRDGIFAGDRRGAGLDSQLLIGPFILWVEALQVRFEPAAGFPRREIEADGGYVQGAYMVLPNRLQLVARYETFDPRQDVDDNEVDTATLGANWYLKGDDLKLVLNYLRSDGPDDLEQDKVIARLQVIF
jgi:phosphate-selective porin